TLACLRSPVLSFLLYGYPHHRHLHSFPTRRSSDLKKADAVRRMSFARRNSRFSRSSCLSRSRSLVVIPPRRPWSVSARRTQPRRVSAVHPIFDAIELIAAHCDGYSLSCSNTMRTARSRTSGEYLVDFFIAPSSQEMEPPEKSGRFNPSASTRSHKVFEMVALFVRSATPNGWPCPGVRGSAVNRVGRSW